MNKVRYAYRVPLEDYKKLLLMLLGEFGHIRLSDGGRVDMDGTADELTTDSVLIFIKNGKLGLIQAPGENVQIIEGKFIVPPYEILGYEQRIHSHNLR